MGLRELWSGGHHVRSYRITKSNKFCSGPISETPTLEIFAKEFSAKIILNLNPRLKTCLTFLRPAQSKTSVRLVNSTTKEGSKYQNHYVFQKDLHKYQK